MSDLRLLADGWALLALTVTWQLAALAALAWLCERVLKLRHPRARYALWWFVLVAPLVLAPGRMALERREAVVRVAPLAVAVQAVRRVRVSAVTPVELAVPEAAAIGARVPEASWWSKVRPGDVLVVAWMLGCLMLVARLVVGHARARRLVGESRAVTDGEAFGALAELCAEAGVKREVGLRVSPSGGAPVLYGLRRPTVLLPTGWLDSMAEDDLRALLAHEVAHIKRRDFLANLIQRLMEVPLFFHPGAWLASRRITLAREELCDGWALRGGADATAYARSLASVAERACTRLAMASVGVAESKFTLLRRVETIMRADRLKKLSRPLVVVAAAVVLAAAAAMAAVSVGERGRAAESRYPWLEESVRGEALQVLTNMKHVALAVHMFMTEHDHVLPSTNDTAELMKVLRPYVKDQSVFLRPGTAEPVVEFTFQPGRPYSSFAKPASTTMGRIDYHPEWWVAASMDGHVKLWPKGAAEGPAQSGGGRAGDPATLGYAAGAFGGGGGGRRVVAADADFMAEALHVQSNMQRLGLAMRSYLLEHAEIFPKADSVDEMLRRLGPYLALERLLVHATIGDPLDVRYLARPGAAVSLAKAAETPFAEATCAALPGLRVVAFADGHAESRPSGEGGSGGGGWALSAVLVNVEHFALAMRAYLTDHNNRFPAATDGRSLVAALETYLNPRLLFTRPGTKDEVVVRYVMKPGTTWSNIPGREAHTVWVFVADYSPEFTVVVDAQMMARIRGTD